MYIILSNKDFRATS